MSQISPPQPPDMSQHRSYSPPIKVWWVTAVIILANSLLFIFQVAQGVSTTMPQISDLLDWGANFAPFALYDQWWRMFSSLFLHIGFMHLAFNMWALYQLGQFSEAIYGHVYYIALFVFAGISANLLSNYMDLSSALDLMSSIKSTGQTLDSNAIKLAMPTVTAGASGAVFGIAASLLVACYWPRRDATDIVYERLLNKQSLLIILAVNLAFGYFVTFINQAAHIGGFIAGLVFAVVFRLITSCCSKTYQMHIYKLIFIILLFLLCFLVFKSQQQMLFEVMPVWRMVLE